MDVSWCESRNWHIEKYQSVKNKAYKILVDWHSFSANILEHSIAVSSNRNYGNQVLIKS